MIWHHYRLKIYFLCWIWNYQNWHLCEKLWKGKVINRHFPLCWIITALVTRSLPELKMGWLLKEVKILLPGEINWQSIFFSGGLMRKPLMEKISTGLLILQETLNGLPLFTGSTGPMTFPKHIRLPEMIFMFRLLLN